MNWMLLYFWPYIRNAIQKLQNRNDPNQTSQSGSEGSSQDPNAPDSGSDQSGGAVRIRMHRPPAPVRAGAMQTERDTRSLHRNREPWQVKEPINSSPPRQFQKKTFSSS